MVGRLRTQLTDCVYLYDDVSDANALYAEWEALENRDGRLIAPHDTPYGLREFGYVDPNGHRTPRRLPLTL
jgi:hypothetical protein